MTRSSVVCAELFLGVGTDLSYPGLLRHCGWIVVGEILLTACCVRVTEVR